MDLLKLETALATPQTNCSGATPSVIWLTGQACSGCQTSLLNRVVNVTGGYYDDDLLTALGVGVSQGTPNDPVAELNYVNDVADLLIGDGVRALTGISRNLSWADDLGGVGALPTSNPFPNGFITLEWLTTVNAGAGDINTEHLKGIVDNNPGGFFLLVDGSVPTTDERYCLVFDNVTYSGGPVLPTSMGVPLHASVTFADALRWMIPQAAAVINIGTCSSWGGIPAGKRNKTGAVSVGEFAANEELEPALGIINVPGCPPHPDWIIYPVAYYLINQALPLMTSDGRPKATYIGANCDNGCMKPGAGDAECLGQDGCLLNLGCKGAAVISDCAARQKNTFDDGSKPNNWCCGNTAEMPGVGDARHPCQGCTESQFPDWEGGFYGVCSNCSA